MACHCRWPVRRGVSRHIIPQPMRPTLRHFKEQGLVEACSRPGHAGFPQPPQQLMFEGITVIFVPLERFNPAGRDMTSWGEKSDPQSIHSSIRLDDRFVDCAAMAAIWALSAARPAAVSLRFLPRRLRLWAIVVSRSRTRSALGAETVNGFVVMDPAFSAFAGGSPARIASGTRIASEANASNRRAGRLIDASLDAKGRRWRARRLPGGWRDRSRLEGWSPSRLEPDSRVIEPHVPSGRRRSEDLVQPHPEDRPALGAEADRLGKVEPEARSLEERE